jgi:fatty acid desaturase
VRQEVHGVRQEVHDLRQDVTRRFEQVDQRFTWLVGTQVATLVAIIAVLVGALYR